MDKRKQERRATLIQALAAGATIEQAAKIAGVTTLQARLWAGSNEAKAVLQPAKRHEPVTYFGKDEA